MLPTKDKEAIHVFGRYQPVILSLVAIVFLLAVASFCGQIYRFANDTGKRIVPAVNHLIEITQVNGENTIPAYFSMFLLLTAAALLTAIYLVKRKLSLPYRKHWLGLAIIFLYLSLDESIALHESFTGFIHRTTGRKTGIFLLAWVIPFGAFVAIFVLVYLRFLWHLSVRSRYFFIMAGAIYVSGTLGMEIVGGYYVQEKGWDLTFDLLLIIEETLEMIGAITFIAALLDYMHRELPDIVLHFQGSGQSSTTGGD